MFITNAVVEVSDKACGGTTGKTKYHGTVDIPWYHFSEADTWETKEKVVDSLSDGKISLTITVPWDKKAVSKTPVPELITAAIADLENRQNALISDPAKRVDPWILALQYLTDGVQADIRMSKYNSLKPIEIDMDKATEKLAMGLLKNGSKGFTKYLDGRKADLNLAVSYVQKML